jgi:hypothetical protein
LKHLAAKHPYLVYNSPRQSTSAEKPQIRVWSDLRTVKDKVRYIHERGLEKFAALLRNRPKLDPQKSPAK